jgi:hypothetical protein
MVEADTKHAGVVALAAVDEGVHVGRVLPCGAAADGGGAEGHWHPQRQWGDLSMVHIGQKRRVSNIFSHEMMI